MNHSDVGRMAACRTEFEEEVINEPYESVAEEIEIVYLDLNSEDTNNYYSYELCEQFSGNHSKMDENCSVEVCVATVDDTVFENDNEFSSDIHCLGEVEISSDPTSTDEWTSESCSTTSTINNSIASLKNISVGTSCQSQSDSFMSRSHDSGTSFTREGVSSFDHRVKRNVDLRQNTDGKDHQIASRAENRVRLCRELDLCHQREVKKVLRTPSPSGNGHFSYIDRSNVENFNVDCYFRSTSTLSPSISLSPCSELSKEGLRLVDFNIPNGNSTYYGDRCEIARPLHNMCISLKPTEQVCDQVEALNLLNSKHKSIKKEDLTTNISRSNWVDSRSSQYGSKYQAVRCNPNTQQNMLLARNSTSNNSSKRPPHSYMNLIQMALCSAPDFQMTLRDIYEWIESSFPYYKNIASRGWKNSIRHNLSLYDIFVRKKASGSVGPKGYWTMTTHTQREQMPFKQHLHNGTDCSDSTANVSSSGTQMSGTTTSDNDRGTTSRRGRSAIRKGPVPLLPKPRPGEHFTKVPRQDCVQDVVPPLSSSQPVRVLSLMSPIGCFIESPTTQSVYTGCAYINSSTESGYGVDQCWSKASTDAAKIQTNSKKRKSTPEKSAPRTKHSKTTESPPLKANKRATRVSTNQTHVSEKASNHNSSTDLSLSDLGGFAPPPFPFVVAVDDSLSLGSSFSSVDLHQQLSHLNVNSAAATVQSGSLREFPSSLPRMEENHVRSEGRPKSDVVWMSCNNVQVGLPKPTIYQRHRRKQEFKILRSPSEQLRATEEAQALKLDADRLDTNRKLILDTPCRNILKAFHGPSIVVSSDSNLNADAISSPSPIAAESDFLRTPDNNRDNNDELEDDNLMLFTPFRRGGGSNIYFSPLPWISPIRYLNCFTPISAGLGAILPSPERESARTSTPFEIPGVDGTPEGKTASAAKASFHLTPPHGSYSRLTPDFNVRGFDSPFGSTPGRWDVAPFGDRSPPEICLHSPTIKRLLSEYEHRGDDVQISLADIAHELNFSPAR